MGIYAAFVLLPPATKQWRDALAAAMEPFYLHRKVKPWHKPVAGYGIKWMLEKLGRNDLIPALEAARAGRLPDEIAAVFLAEGPAMFGPRPRGTVVGIGDDGLPWEMTDENHLGTWDSWTVGGRFDGMIVHAPAAERAGLIEGLPTGEISSGGFMDEILRSFGVVEMPRTASLDYS
jgi:hypothetical protein